MVLFPTAATNLLHDIDRAAQDIVDRVTLASAAASGGAPGIVTFGNDLPSLNVHRPVSELCVELHRYGLVDSG
jgi:hypothetical protein